MNTALRKPIARLVLEWYGQATPGIYNFGTDEIIAKLRPTGITASAEDVHAVLEHLEASGCFSLIQTFGPTDTIGEVYPRALGRFV